MSKSSLTKKQQRMIKYNEIIAKNKTAFKAGKFFTRNDFIKIFELVIPSTGTHKEMTKANLDLVQAQAEINMLMRENGLYIRSRDYYSEFHVSEKAKTKRTVLRYRKESDVMDHCGDRLKACMGQRIKAGTWGTYNKVPISRIRGMRPYDPSEEYRNDRNGMKWW